MASFGQGENGSKARGPTIILKDMSLAGLHKIAHILEILLAGQLCVEKSLDVARTSVAIACA